MNGLMIIASCLAVILCTQPATSGTSQGSSRLARPPLPGSRPSSAAGVAGSGGGGTCSFDAHHQGLWCSLRTLNTQNNTTTDVWLQSSNRAKRISVQCSDVFFYESILRTNHFGYLPNLAILQLEYCKIRRIPSLAFSGLSGLRDLVIRTHNSEWSAMVMELEADAFTGLNNLHHLNLTQNNLWTAPRSTFCGLHSLRVLNLSVNFLQDANELGFNQCNIPLEKLDLSYNSLAAIPAHAFSQLSSLELLRLDNNRLNILEDQAFSDLRQLKVLSLANNELVALPPELFEADPSTSSTTAIPASRLEELYLQNNSLSVLAPGLFNPLEHLLVLNLSRNELTNDWVTSSSLRPLVRLVALDMSYNKLTKLDQSMLSGLTALQILNVGNNNIHTVSANTFLFQHNLHILLLSHNDLETLHPRAVAGLPVLNSLSLDHNQLRSLHRNALRNCSSLQDLALNNNLLEEVPKAIRPLTLLRTLDIGENRIANIRSKDLDGLHNLYGLRLAGNGIQNLQDDVFKSVSTLQVLNLAHNNIQKMNHSVFNPLKELRMLRMDNNKLQDINGLLQAQADLQWLNVSANQLQWFDYAFIPRSLKWLDLHQNEIEELGNYYSVGDGYKLTTLDASQNHIKKLSPLSLPPSLEYVILNENRLSIIEPNTFVNKMNLSRVELTSNHLERLDLSSLAISYNTSKAHSANSLPQFFLGGNPFFCDCEMEWLQKINQMAHRGTHPRVMDLDNVRCGLNNNNNKDADTTHGIANSNNIQPHRVPIMQIQSHEFLCPYQAHCFALCMCCDFFACDCRMQCPEGCSCFHDSTWSANVIQCSHRGHFDVPPLIPMDATSIYLDGNHFNGTLESQAFIGRKRVTSLFLNNSMIGAISNQTFNGLTELEVLHLEDNLIHGLQGYEFGNLTSLRELYLQGNRLAYIDSEAFSSLVSLEVLFLHDNLLTLQPIWELTQLMPLLKQVTLSGNPWSCQCDFVSHFVAYNVSSIGGGSHRLITDRSSITCQPTTKEDPPRYFLTDANSTCTDALAITGYSNPNNALGGSRQLNQAIPITVASIAVCIVIVVSSIILFVFRTPLRVWLHSKYGVRICTTCCRGANSSGFSGQSGGSGGKNRDKLYDAFVSYSLKDEEFVHHILVNQLEISEEPGYKLCLQHRDLPHNTNIAETYPSVTALCAQQILIVSKAFLETEWPNIKYSIGGSLNLKRQHCGKPLLLMIENVTPLDLAKNPEFNLLLKTAIVIRWSETGCWNKLKYYLPDAIHFTYRRNINLTNTMTSGGGGGATVPNTPKLTERLTSGGSRSPACNSSINMQQLYHHHSNTNSHHHPFHHHQTSERGLPRPQRGQLQQGGGGGQSTSWPYENSGPAPSTANMMMIHSNNSSTSTRSTVTNGGSPRTLSSTEDSSSGNGCAPPLPPPTSSGCAPTPIHAHVVTNPLDQLSSSLNDGLEQWSDRSDSAYSWHDHTYQTIPSNQQQHHHTELPPSLIRGGPGEPIYHTLDPDGTGGGAGTIPVMLPNGRLVPATLVRNSSGRIVPLVQVPQPSSSSTTTSKVSAFATSSRSSASKPMTTTVLAAPSSQVTSIPKTIVYKSPSRSGYLV